MFLLTTVALCCALVAGALAVLKPAPAVLEPALAVLQPVYGEPPAKQVADSRPIDSSAPSQVRVVGGAAFVPNVNPRQR
ncbi:MULTISPECIES: hypothetical protein [unclassified Bradyrhizobium]|uniref:hypothetical protein n=1 Tax=unclassified Bradyrhizobium TaxID=2631580 RepID=UPI0020B24603|nr:MULTISPECIES: hypothetical protein [unclassified Bradyrhizobium]MCP3384101.1 hypothetical protein [Bradyrhizobium sp. CCGUVB4N]MCP3445187.1 hypothetical protein [Bradyrhizobium sp. CCGUVB14]